MQADYAYGGPMPRMRLAGAKAYAADESALPTEPGKSTVRVMVQGSVQMLNPTEINQRGLLR